MWWERERHTQNVFPVEIVLYLYTVVEGQIAWIGSFKQYRTVFILICSLKCELMVWFFQRPLHFLRFHLLLSRWLRWRMDSSCVSYLTAPCIQTSPMHFADQSASWWREGKQQVPLGFPLVEVLAGLLCSAQLFPSKLAESSNFETVLFWNSD